MNFNSQWKTKWDRRYQGDEFIFGREPNTFLAENHAEIRNGRILCAGDGEGRNGVWLARQGHQVCAIDYSPVGLEKAGKLAAEYQVSLELIEANILQHDFPDNSFDAIVNIYLHMTAAEIAFLHGNYRRWLNPGGILLAEVYSKKQLGNTSGGPQSLEALYEVDYYDRDFSDFEQICLQEDKVILAEGDAHVGEADVIRAILRKPLDQT